MGHTAWQLEGVSREPVCVQAFRRSPTTAARNTIYLSGAQMGEQAMRLIMAGAIQTAPHCGPPAYCWRVTLEGIAQVFELPGHSDVSEG